MQLLVNNVMQVIIYQMETVIKLIIALTKENSERVIQMEQEYVNVCICNYV